MVQNRSTPEQIMGKLGEIEVHLGPGMTKSPYKNRTHRPSWS